jgi:CBS domain-containing protein
VGDVMTKAPLTLPESFDVGDGIDAMNARGVRRAPVITEAGSLVGMVTFDDLLPAVARELQWLANLMGTQARRPAA